MDSATVLLEFLKSEGFIKEVDKARSELVEEEVVLRNATDLFVRDSIMGLGTIMKEDLNMHYYITTVKVGFFRNILTHAIIQRNGPKARMTVYAHEGLIHGHHAGEAIEKLKAVLC